MLLLAALVIAPGAVRADGAAAEALFQEGRAAASRGDHATACAKFQESNRLDPAVGTVFNIGDCSEKIGRVATAWQSFREVQQRLPSNDERVGIAKKRADALEARLPKLTIVLVDAPAGAKVRRDGVELGDASLKVALPVDPGSHVVDVTAPGRKDQSFPFTIREAEKKTLEVKAGPAEDKPVPTTTASTTAAPPPSGTATSVDVEPGDGRKKTGIVVLGVGGGVFVVGAVLGVLTMQKKSTADDNCPDKRCNAEGYDAVKSGRTLGTLSTVGLGLGLVGMGVGGYLLASSPKKESALAPWVGPGSGGVSYARRF